MGMSHECEKGSIGARGSRISSHFIVVARWDEIAIAPRKDSNRVAKRQHTRGETIAIAKRRNVNILQDVDYEPNTDNPIFAQFAVGRRPMAVFRDSHSVIQNLSSLFLGFALPCGSVGLQLDAACPVRPPCSGKRL